MKKWYKAAGILFSLAVTAYFIHFAYQTFSRHEVELSLSFGDFAWLLVALLAYISNYFITSYCWHRLLNSIGETSTFGGSLTIISVSQFGKYLPGNVGHFVGRFSMGKARGLSFSAISTTMFIELVWSVTAIALISLLFLSLSGLDIPKFESLSLFATAAVLALLLVASYYSPAILTLGYKKGLLNVKNLRSPDSMTLTSCTLLYGTSPIIMGAALVIIFHAVADVTNTDWFVLIGLFGLTWLAGFITPGAPAGLGVREGLLAASLTPLYGAEAALEATIWLRLVTLSGDLVIFASGLLSIKISQRKQISANTH